MLINAATYRDSRTHAARQYWGPSETHSSSHKSESGANQYSSSQYSSSKLYEYSSTPSSRATYGTNAQPPTTDSYTYPPTAIGYSDYGKSYLSYGCALLNGCSSRESVRLTWVEHLKNTILLQMVAVSLPMLIAIQSSNIYFDQNTLFFPNQNSNPLPINVHRAILLLIEKPLPPNHRP